MKRTFWLTFLVGFSLSCYSQISIRVPISGQHLKDFYIVNHVDHDTMVNSLRDYNCGERTYDGHMGTDFVLPSFKAMDAGVNVLAAANGKIIYIKDSLFDRQKNGDPSKTYGNLIIIEHSDSFYTYYAHLKKNSVKVSLGQTVNQGDVLAEVGSSGYSTDPHLHFEMYYKDTLLDPFYGNCSYFYSGYMQNQIFYDSSRGTIGSGLINFTASLDTLKEELPSILKLKAQDTSVTYWIHLKGSKKNDVAKVEWIAPDSSLWFQFSSVIPVDYYYYYWYSWIYNPIQNPGVWKARFYLNNVLLEERSFEVEAASGLQKQNKKTVKQPEVYYNQEAKTLHVQSQFKLSSLEIYDAQGKCVRKVDAVGLEHIVDLLPGIYFIRTASNGNVFVNKIIVR